MISKIRCQKEKINTQAKVSDQGLSLRGLFQKLRVPEAPAVEVTLPARDLSRFAPGSESEQCIVVVKCMGGP